MSQLQNPNILLVEDSVVNRIVTLKQLERLGYSAEIATNGQEALERVHHSDYDIVLMDCEMPLIDGYEATRELRRLEAGCQPTVIIAITTDLNESEQQRCGEAGMDACLRKPVRQEELSQLLSQWHQMAVARENNARVEGQHSDPVSPEVPLDWSHLHLIADHDPEFEFELLALFVEDSTNHLATLREAIADQDVQAIEQAAHHIKGASANIGARTMQRAAATLELQARQNCLEGEASLLAALAASLGQIKSLLVQEKQP